MDQNAPIGAVGVLGQTAVERELHENGFEIVTAARVVALVVHSKRKVVRHNFCLVKVENLVRSFVIVKFVLC